MLISDGCRSRSTSKKNRRLVLASASQEGEPRIEIPLDLPSFELQFCPYPSAVIQRGGRVGFFSVQHGKIVAYKSYI